MFNEKKSEIAGLITDIDERRKAENAVLRKKVDSAMTKPVNADELDDSWHYFHADYFDIKNPDFSIAAQQKILAARSLVDAMRGKGVLDIALAKESNGQYVVYVKKAKERQRSASQSDN